MINCFLYIIISLFLVLFSVKMLVEKNIFVEIYNNIEKQTNKNEYYLKKTKIISVITMITNLLGIILVVVFHLFIDKINIYEFDKYFLLVKLLFLSFIVLLILGFISSVKRRKRIINKYEMSLNGKIINRFDLFDDILMYFLYLYIIINILLTNKLTEDLYSYKINLTISIIFIVLVLVFKFIIKLIISIKTHGNWFNYVKVILKLFTKKPDFIYLGDKPIEPSLHLCNHVGSKGPLRLELFYKHKFRFWGTYEMNSGTKSTYKYLSTIYFQNKKHFKPFIAKIIAFIATPLLNMMYLGLNLISTYPDMRLKTTLRETIKILKKGESIVIFPENSSNGYFDTLIEFEPGFVLLLERALTNRIDLPVYIMYFQKKNNRYIVDKKVHASELLSLGLSKEELAEKMKNRCNELANF